MPLCEVAQVQLGRQRSPQHHTGPNMRPYLRAANVTWHGLELSDVKVMNFSETEMETFRLLPNDILVNEASGSASEVGKPAIFHGEIDNCGFQNHLIRIRAFGADTGYLFYFLRWNALSGAYLSESQGVGINHLGKTKLAAWSTPLPTLAEQQRIVEILEEQFSRLDAALASIRRVREKAAMFRQSLLQAAFSGELSVDGTAAWEQLPLTSVAAIINGDRGKNYPSKSYRTTSGVPFINAGHLVANRIDMSDMDFISREHFNLLGNGKLATSDLLFCLRGSLGKVALNTQLHEGAIASSLAIVRPNEHVLPPYLFYYFQSPFSAQMVKQFDNGTAQPNLAAGNLRKFIVPLPPLDEQGHLVGILDDQFSRLDAAGLIANQLEARIASEQRSLLHAAFSGTLTAQWRETHNG